MENLHNSTPRSKRQPAYFRLAAIDFFDHGRHVVALASESGVRLVSVPPSAINGHRALQLALVRQGVQYREARFAAGKRGAWKRRMDELFRDFVDRRRAARRAA